jgi:ATP/maltotriose-dependent transcriptional regulator MalT
VVGGEDELARGREAARKLAWADAFAQLAEADRVSPLAADDLELMSTAALLLGHVEEALELLRRAHQLHLDRGDRRRAARCAGWLAVHLGDRGELAQANGWLARANRLLEHEPECAEHGYALLPVAVKQLGTGDPGAALVTLDQATGIGRRCDEADLVALALTLHGRALLMENRVSDGLVLMDEAMVAVVAGELSPLVSGTIYCAMIEGCQEIYEFRRAREWTETLTAWWSRQPDLVTFTGQCLIHRAELLHLRGAWPEAVAEARRAGERLALAADKHATGAALYRQAETHRVLGEFSAAEDAYQQANRWGHQPQPGLALLRLAQGRGDVAQAAIRRVVQETTDPLSRIKLLPAQVEIMLAAGDVQAARDATTELAQRAGDYGTPALQALAGQARGAVALADGDAGAAIVPLREAWRIWHELEVPYEAARVRALIGVACRELGDDEAATMELEAARTVLARLGAAPELARLGTLTGRGSAGERHRLSRRELEVLRLLATGRTNHAIAADLVLAEKTVDRHVSNILAKLGVPSRAAATAYAYQHRLL